jgi:tRNA A37 threonylcarbamoyladenosine dehydratase
MDNFDWIEFLELIGVPMHKIKVGPGGYGSFGLELLEREGIDVNTLHDFMDE